MYLYTTHTQSGKQIVKRVLEKGAASPEFSPELHELWDSMLWTLQMSDERPVIGHAAPNVSRFVAHLLDGVYGEARKAPTLQALRDGGYSDDQINLFTAFLEDFHARRGT